MDRKSIIVLVVSFILLMLWYPLVVNKLYPPKPSPALTNAPAMSGGSTGQISAPPTPPSIANAPASPTRPLVTPSAPEQLLELTNANAHYTVTSYGGGIKEIELIHYPEIVTARGEKAPPTRGVASLNTRSPNPTLALLDGAEVEGDGAFVLYRTEKGVKAEKTLTNGLTIVKEFRPSTNYLMATTVRLENRSDKPLALPQQEWVVGTATPMGPFDNGQAVGALWYNGAGTEQVGASFFSDRNFACMPRIPPAEYRGGASNVVWAAAQNQFFALVSMPQQAAEAVVVRKVTLPREDFEHNSRTPPTGYTVALVYPPLVLEPGKSIERNIHIFAGPKEYRTLARIGAAFNNNVDLVMGYGGFFGFFAKALLLTMNWLHDAAKLSYAWAIIVITVIIKLLFWPLTQASTRSMKRMQQLQPQIKAIQEKYKDDPVKMNRKTMEFMKENKVSPLGGCLPMLLQIPVFFGFYRMIQSAIELRGAAFLWISDLSKPDTLFFIPGTDFPFNLLPLIMGATMLWQARLTPPSPGMDPTQAKIMKYMPLMFMVFLYNFSAGLTLYWTVQNLLTIAQTKLTKTASSAAVPAQTPQRPVLTHQTKKRK